MSNGTVQRVPKKRGMVCVRRSGELAGVGWGRGEEGRDGGGRGEGRELIMPKMR